jgi:hypothetical protein
MIPKATDAEVLLDEEKFGPFTIRPWSIIKCCSMSPIIEKIANEVKKRGLSYRDFFVKEGEAYKSINTDQLFFIITPFLPEILCITLDVEMKDIETLPRDNLMGVLATIVSQNAGYLKNFFALIASMNQDLRNVTI